MSTTLTPFSPSPKITDAVIDALNSPDNTLRAVANQFRTTVEALTLWMTRPDIAQRLDNIQSAACRRTRLIATNFLPSVVKLLNTIINHHLADEHGHESAPLAPEPRRHRENARKAAALILRLAQFMNAGGPSPQAARSSLAPPLRPKATRPASHLDAPMPPAPMPSSASPASLPHLLTQVAGLSRAPSASSVLSSLPAVPSGLPPVPLALPARQLSRDSLDAPRPPYPLPKWTASSTNADTSSRSAPPCSPKSSPTPS